MIVDSNSEAPLQYVDPTYQALLFVRASIYDLTTGTPVLEDTVDLSLLGPSIYWGKYGFTAGRIYQVQKAVYTDGTYVTIDEDYPQSVDDVQCIDLSIPGFVPPHNPESLKASIEESEALSAVVGEDGTLNAKFDCE